MSTLYLTDQDIEKLVTVSETIESLRQVFRQLEDGTAFLAPRTRVSASSGTLDMMGAISDEWGFAATKSYCIAGGRMNFLLMLFATGEAEPVAVMQAKKLGQVRTGAASGLATDILSAGDANVMGCIGTGYQAGAQVDAVVSVRPIERIMIHSRNPAHMRRFGKAVTRRHGIDVVELEKMSQEFAAADVVSCITDSATPVIDASMLGESCHINAVGGYRPDMVEVGVDVISSCATVVADLKEQAMKESGELISAVASGKLDWGEVSEMKDIVAGRVLRRAGASSNRTFFKSLGVAVEDLAVAKLAYDAALANGAGLSL